MPGNKEAMQVNRGRQCRVLAVGILIGLIGVLATVPQMVGQNADRPWMNLSLLPEERLSWY